MSSKRDCYDILGIPRTASDDQIKKAYRKLAMKYHPDRNPGDKTAEEKFKEATEAYEILSKTDARQRYDQFGWDAFEHGRAGGGGFGGFGGGIDLEEAMRAFSSAFGGGFGGGGGGIFETLFGGGRTRDTGNGRSRGADLRYDLDIDFEEAAFGSQRELAVNIVEDCTACHGTGAEGSSQRETCRQCGGRGMVVTSSGFFQMRQPCPACGGTGQIVKNPCHACQGEGRVQVQRKINLTIPAGVDTGSRLRLAGKGEGGARGGEPGDLFIVFRVRDHELFQRDGLHTFCEIPVPFHILTLGGEILVPTLRGDVPLKIPAGAPPGKVFTLRGLGLPDLRGRATGDHLVRVIVETPDDLPRNSRDLLAAFGASLKETNHPKLASLRQKAKRFYARKETMTTHKK